MLKIDYFNTDEIDNSLLKYAIIAATHNGKWIFCRHKERDTYEIPGGHREAGENIRDTAKRELFEETGAIDSIISPVCTYSVSENNVTTYGMLFLADVKRIGELPKEMEMAEIIFCDGMPDKLTYPLIQPFLFEKAKELLIG